MSAPRDLLWTTSRLLSYPSADLLRQLPELERAVAESSGPHRARLGRFLQHVRASDPIDLEEEYVRTFDLGKGSSLYLTYAQHGDGRGRGAALAQLKGRYHAAGLELEARELPDFLPLVLEFLSLAPDPASAEIAREFADQVGELASGLASSGSPYADVVEPAAAALRQLAGTSRGRWWGR